MPVNHGAVAALPSGGQANSTLLRTLLVTRMAYCLSPSEDSRDLIVIDPAGDGTTPALIQNGLIYGLDDADGSTAHDGVTCLVSYDSKRYKLEAGLHAPFNVLDKDLTAPPTSPTPSYGDAYLIYGAPTGAWAGETGTIAIYTARGWSFATVPIGFLVYVRDERSYYYRDYSGTWQAGTGTRTLGTNSVPVSTAINFGRVFIIENQTTNAPPGSPSTGTAYIVGPAPTGAWALGTSKIAICEDGATFTLYTAGNGWQAYDKSLNAFYTFNGSVWQSSAGTWVGHLAVQTVSGSTTAPSGTSPYTYSSGTAPTTSNRRLIDTVTLSYTTKKSGATLRFHYSADVTYTTGSGGPGNGDLIVGLFRDSVSNAMDWQRAPYAAEIVSLEFAASSSTSTAKAHLDCWFEVTSPDAGPHTYFVALTSQYLSGTQLTDAGSLTRRTFEVEESV